MRCSVRLCLQLRAHLLFVLFVFICVWWCLMNVDSSFGLFMFYCPPVFSNVYLYYLRIQR
jgi:hypothetical protein